MLGNRWEYLPFEMLEARGDTQWEPLIGEMEAVAVAIGQCRVPYLMIEREAIRGLEETWWWLIYWK
jgi:hypothetical protein